MPLKLVPPRPEKSPFWYVRGTHRGVTLDRSTKETERAKANRWLRKWKDDIDSGCFSTRSDPTFLDAAVNYMAATGIERFVRPLVDHFGERDLRLVDQEAIDRAAQHLYPHASAQTKNRQVYSVVSAILKHAGIDGTIRRPKGAHYIPPVQWLWPEQTDRIFAAAAEIDKEFEAFLITLCYTGQRLSEAGSLRINDLRLSEAFVFLPDSKNGEPRAIHLPPIVVAALASHPRGLDRPGQRIFRFRKNKTTYAVLERVLNRVGEDLAWVRFHTFCHTYGTWMRRYGGLDQRGLVGTGRWKSEKSAGRYAHVVTSEESRKADLLPTPARWRA
jgi:integrase